LLLLKTSPRNQAKLIGLLSMTLLALGCFIIGFDGLYGQDGYAYLYQINHMDSLLKQDSFYPPFYAFVGWIAQWLVQNPVLSLQWVSLLSWLGTFILLYKIVTQTYSIPPKTALTVLLIAFLLSPFVLRMSILVMSDALAMFMALLTVYLGLFSKNNYAHALFFIVAALALLTRYALGVLLLPSVVFVVIQFIKNKSLQHWIFVILGGIIGLSMLVLNFVYFTNAQGSTQHTWLQLWDLRHFFQTTFDHQDGSVNYTFPNLIYAFKNVFHPIYAIVFIPALFLIKRIDFVSIRTKILLLSFLLYALFLAGIPFQNDRFLLVSFPFLILLLFFPLQRLHLKIGKMNWAVWALIPIQLALAVQLLKPVYDRNQLEQNLLTELAPFQGKTIYSFDIDIALEGRGFDAEFINIWTSHYDQFKVGAYVLFNATKFAAQWDGKNPMLNWNDLNQNYALVSVLKLQKGWELFEIKSEEND
jgi:4-amino-4-deoxy-L-arabinose transferase-like glycosyltransferase